MPIFVDRKKFFKHLFFSVVSRFIQLYEYAFVFLEDMTDLARFHPYPGYGSQHHGDNKGRHDFLSAAFRSGVLCSTKV